MVIVSSAQFPETRIIIYNTVILIQAGSLTENHQFDLIGRTV